MEDSNGRIAALLRAGQAASMTWRAGSLNGSGPIGFVDPLPITDIDTDRMARVEIAAVGVDWVEVQHFVADDAGNRFRRFIPFQAISSIVVPPKEP